MKEASQEEVKLSSSSTGEDSPLAEKYVIKRNGSHEKLDLDKIKRRIERQAHGLNMEYIDIDIIVAKLASGIYQGTK